MSKRAHETDVLAGIRLRLRRDELRLTQSDIARQLGVTFQQVQKYEKAEIRISASRLQELSRILEVPVGYFFPEPAPGEVASHVEAAQELRATKDLLRDFDRIGSLAVRKAVRGLVKAIEEAERVVAA